MVEIRCAGIAGTAPGAGANAPAIRPDGPPGIIDKTMRRLTRADVPARTPEFARYLIGKLLLRRLEDGGVLAGRIVETEAYTPGDPASHAFRGRTKRNQSMYREPLHAYVYFIYGTAFCLNVSSDESGIGAAVLLRALEPVKGLPIMRRHRGEAVADRDLLRGPGRLCAALAVDRGFDGADLETDPRLWLADDGAAAAVGVSTRIGLTKGAEVPHRFYARGSAYLSGRRQLSPDH